MRVTTVLQTGLPEIFTDLLSIAGTVVLVLMIIAIGAFAYKSLTGGVEWPEEPEEDDDALRQGDQDDEWDYY